MMITRCHARRGGEEASRDARRCLVGDLVSTTLLLAADKAHTALHFTLHTANRRQKRKPKNKKTKKKPENNHFWTPFVMDFFFPSFFFFGRGGGLWGCRGVSFLGILNVEWKGWGFELWEACVLRGECFLGILNVEWKG